MSKAEEIKRMRTAAGLTVKGLAEKSGIEIKTLYDLEEGIAFPSDRQAESLKIGAGKESIKADLPSLHSWELYSDELMTEYRQCIEEGLAVKEYEALFKAVSEMPRNEYRERMADVIFDIVSNAPETQGYAYVEPTELCEIRAERGEPIAKVTVPPKALEEKTAGAWYGRICGCFLGKAVEGIRTDELVPFLKKTGNYPMHRYISHSDLTPENLDGMRYNLNNGVHPDEVKSAPADDDTNYLVLYQELVEKYGKGFTSKNVADFWLDKQPKNAYCTAERVAFCNFVKGYTPPDSAKYKNPFREWIGAQIRGDYFGYISLGDPEAAAEAAYRDAIISHTKNGVYGEMYFAALIARAAVTKDIREALLTCLAVVPRRSRFHESIMQIINAFDGGMTSEECFAQIHERWNEHSGHDWCHVLSNAEIVAASLLYGGGDYGKTVCLAVQTGFDTDCNAATAGSVIGVMHGISAIGEEWTAPMHGKLDTQIFGVGTVNIDDRIAMTLRHIKEK